MMGNIALLLKHVGKIIDLTDDERRFFSSLIAVRRLQKKEILLLQGEPCHCEYFILEGCLRVFSTDISGDEHTMYFGMEEWWVGDPAAFFTRTASSYSIAALEDSTVVMISRENLELLYRHVPKFERYFRILIQNAFVAQQERINQNQSLTADERYRRFLEKYPGINQRVSQKMIASYLGITPEFLSAIRKKIR